MTGSLSESEMTAHDVCGFLDLMDAYGTRVWLDGGWALDPALAPSRGVTATSTSLSRSAMCRWPSRFSKVASMPRAPSRHPRMELRPRRRRRAPDRLPRHHARTSTDAVYGPSENGEYYPSEALTGKGTVNGRTVNCITPFSGWCNSTPATGSWPAPHFSDDRRASVHDRSEERRHRPDETLDLALAKTVAEVPHPLRVGLHPERPVRVAPHLGHVWVAQGGKRRGAELAAELGIQPLLLLRVSRSHASAPPSRLSCTAVSPFMLPDRTKRWNVLRQFRSRRLALATAVAWSSAGTSGGGGSSSRPAGRPCSAADEARL